MLSQPGVCRPGSLVYKKRHVGYEQAIRHEKRLKKKSQAYKEKLAGDELEREGYLRQIGKTGKNVTYTKG